MDESAIELPSVKRSRSDEGPPTERSPIRATHSEHGNFPVEERVPELAPPAPRQSQRAFRFPWLRAACAVFMLAFGVACGISAAAVWSLALGVVCLLLVIPGAYMTFVYYQVYRNNPRFTSDRWLGLEPLEEDGA
jgi:hypothetical protein